MCILDYWSQERSFAEENLQSNKQKVCNSLQLGSQWNSG